MEKTETATTLEESLKALFHSRFGEKVEELAALRSDGSSRRYHRIRSAKRTVIGAHGPDAKENAAFLGFSKQFKSMGLPVPEIYAEDAPAGIYLEEDFGETNLFEHLSSRRTSAGFSDDTVAIYEAAVRMLPQFQITAGRKLDYSICYPRARFDRQSMMWDLNHFKYYFLTLSKTHFDESALEEDFNRLADYLCEAEQDYFLYRDFQSRNIMVQHGSPRFIDYQGGRRGALQYDIASLLFDAKADMPYSLRERLLSGYMDAVGGLIKLDREKFLGHYHGYVFIRIMQALGTYGLRGFYERKVHFLKSIPYAMCNLEYLLRTAELPVKLPALWEVFRALIGSSYLRQFTDAKLRLTVRIQSFSYRAGVPADAKGHGGGYVFDCRSLPNPGRHERYADLTGKDPEVIDFLDREQAVHGWLDKVFGIIDQSVENYQGRNFTDLLVAFGCTGGQHRSVYCAERLADHLRSKFDVDVEVAHLARR
ncbi:MAG: RNase adapter RapZ [Elusimicrobiota bacterium]|jgi:aminoglycoside/choline kinase family phosphotransferase